MDILANGIEIIQSILLVWYMLAMGVPPILQFAREVVTLFWPLLTSPIDMAILCIPVIIWLRLRQRRAHT